MFKAVKEKDDFGSVQTRFTLTRGDSCTIKAMPQNNGVAVDTDLIDACVFKLSDSNYKQEFTKRCELEDGRYVLHLTSEETSSFDVGEHIYEFEYTFVDGNVFTPNQYFFEIVKEIRTTGV